jgi:hypothetical protein
VKRLLVVAFAVPPTPGSSPGRAWHLARRLPSLGWEAIVLTPRHPQRLLAALKTREHRDFPIPLRRVLDPAGNPFWLQETEYRDLRASRRLPARRATDGLTIPGLYGKERIGEDEAALEEPLAPMSAVQSAIAALRFYPDERAGWIRPAIDGALAACAALKADAVYSFSPPVSAHAIAAHIAGRTGLPWVADLREPWRGNPARWIDRWNRARILRGAIRVSLAPSYDPADIPPRAAEPFNALDAVVRTPVLVHAGSMAVRGREPNRLLDAVRLAAGDGSGRDPGFRIRLLGARDPLITRAIGERSLGRVITVEATVPWTVSMDTQARADALLILLGDEERDRIPDRLLEAMSAGRPVFALGPPGSRTERLIREAALGSYHTSAASLAEQVGLWLEKGASASIAPPGEAAAAYRSESVAAKLVEAIEGRNAA